MLKLWDIKRILCRETWFWDNKEIYREERNLINWFKAWRVTDRIILPNSPKRPSYPEACGLRHLAFEVDDIEEAVKELKGKIFKLKK